MVVSRIMQKYKDNLSSTQPKVLTTYQLATVLILREAVTSLDVSVTLQPGFYPSSDLLGTTPFVAPTIRSTNLTMTNSLSARQTMTQALCDNNQPQETWQLRTYPYTLANSFQHCCAKACTGTHFHSC
jgi:hypothetical protein